MITRREACRLLAAGPAAMAMAASASLAAENTDQPKKAGKVLMPIGEATEVVDTLYPYFRLQEEGFEVVVAGPKARTYHMVTHEVPPNADIPWDITQEGPGYHLKAAVAFADVDPREFAGLFVSGGRAPEYLRYDKDLMRVTRHFFDAGKPVAVVCHGVEIVAAAGRAEGSQDDHRQQMRPRHHPVWRHVRQRALRRGRHPDQLSHLARLPHAPFMKVFIDRLQKAAKWTVDGL